ncbi:MAG TPA: cation:proton antiporter, partial [Bacteroidales bacterium]|nr:cation:proton antiporter [Bacteroidales bacterium]
MKVARNSLFYIVTIGVFALVMWVFIEHGKLLQHSGNSVVLHESSLTNGQVSGTVPENTPIASVVNFFHKPLALLILQIIIILVISRLLGYFSQRIKQPSVIGEIVAGIILGPSVLGAFFPQLFAFIFPPESIEILHFLSQIGLILFMFIVGMELDFNILKRSAGTAIMVSHASIIFPFALGVGLSYFLYPRFAPGHVSFLAFSLFLGTAMSITALPILARIIQERGLTHTKLGTLALTCGAIDDITAWGILAAVIAIVNSGTWLDAGLTFGLSAVYILAMIFLVKPFLKKIGMVY